MANIVRRAVGPNDAGIPEDEIRDIIIPMILPAGMILIDPKTGDTFDHEGKKIARERGQSQRGQMKTPHELACAISALINAKPRSPTIAELEGVIREHWQEAPEERVAVAVTGKSASQELARRIMEIMRDDDGKAAPDSRAIPMTGVAASLKPPMVVVTDRIRDSICLGGVGYGI